MDLHKCKIRLENGELLNDKEVQLLAELSKEILMEESNTVPVNAPVNVCGDIHGQFWDLLELFRKGGDINTKNYVFLGDYVDRGYHSIETTLYLLVLKCLYPHKITLIRGNHESRVISQSYGFYDEINQKYGHTGIFRIIMEVFDYLPISAIIEGKMLLVHGGLSPDVRLVDQIRLIDRKMEIPTEGAYAHLMWSDPEETIKDWQISPRGAGYMFGFNVVKKFNHINGLDFIVRAHQLIMEGYKHMFNEMLVTIWSAPNYCYRMNNKATILQIDENLNKNYLLFKESPQSIKSQNPQNVLPYFL